MKEATTSLTKAPRRSKIVALALFAVLFAACLLLLAKKAEQAEAQTTTTDAGRIAFISDRDASLSDFDFQDIYTMKSDGTDVQRMARKGVQSWPAISPDGNKIAYAGQYYDSQSGKQYDGVFVMKSDGSGQDIVIASQEDGGYWDYPTWSPDSKQLAFMGYRFDGGPNQDNSSSDIYVRNADGTGDINNVSNTNNTDEAHPSWSSGGKIAFASRYPPRTDEFLNNISTDIYEMNATDGSGRKNLTKTSQWWEDFPSYSPNGQQIAYSSVSFTDPTTNFSYDIWTMKADGTEQTNKTQTPYPDDEHFPSWSPDGTKLAYTAYRSEASYVPDILTANATDGSGEQNLTKDYESPLFSRPSFDLTAKWGPSPTSSEPVDTLAPITKASRSVEPNSEGWNKEDVTITLKATDETDGSGVKHISYSATGALQEEKTVPGDTAEIPITQEGETKITFRASDNSDNLEEPQEITVKVDKTDPTVSINSPSGSYLLDQQAVVADYQCADETGGSGLASCSGDLADGFSIDTSAVGPKTFKVAATDKAGNQTEKVVDYKVVYDFVGFFDPVNMSGVFNKTNAGSAIPVKFTLGGNQGLSVLYTGYPRSVEVPCDSKAPTDPIEETVSASSSSLTYDQTTGQYRYVWKTDKAWAGTCRQLVVKFNDGEEYRAYFDFRR